MTYREKNMRSKFLKVALFLVVFLASVSIAKENIAIMEITGTVSKSEAGILTDKALNLFANSGKYKVIERSMMAEILKEQEFQQTGCTSSECAVQVGQILGVENIVFGSVGKLGSIYSISLRLISVGTGEIVKTASFDLKGSIEDVLVKGIKNVVDQLIDVDDNESDNVKSDEKVKKEPKEKIVLSPEEAYNKRVRTKKIWMFLNAGGGVVSAGASAYFFATMNSEKEKYDKMTSGDFEAKWRKVENSRNFTIISASTAACFTTAAIVLAVVKIETPGGKTLALMPGFNGSEASLTFNLNF